MPSRNLRQLGLWLVCGRLAVCRFRLARVECAHCLDGVRLRGRFVGTVSFHACESQSESARIVRTGLNIIECNFDDDFRPHRDRVAVRRKLKGFELLGLPDQHFIRHAFKGFAQHDEAAVDGIARPQMQITEPSLAPTASPFDGQDNQVQSMGPFNFEPCAAPTTCLIGRVQRLRHDAFVTLTERFMQKGFSGGQLLSHEARGDE